MVKITSNVCVYVCVYVYIYIYIYIYIYTQGQTLSLPIVA